MAMKNGMSFPHPPPLQPESRIQLLNVLDRTDGPVVELRSVLLVVSPLAVLETWMLPSINLSAKAAGIRSLVPSWAMSDSPPACCRMRSGLPAGAMNS